jgi:rubrerythrin
MCVACHAPFVEVHHITPEAENGLNTLDNAAPLCAGCHAIYGGNPVFRKQITQMRDNWYDVCEKRFSPSNLKVAQQVNTMAETLGTVRADQVKYQQILNEIKSAIVGSLAGTASVINSAQTLEEIVTASGYPTTSVYLGPNVYANFKCRNCGTIIGLLVGNDKCPRCGTPIKS